MVSAKNQHKTYLKNKLYSFSLYLPLTPYPHLKEKWQMKYPGITYLAIEE